MLSRSRFRLPARRSRPKGGQPPRTVQNSRNDVVTRSGRSLINDGSDLPEADLRGNNAVPEGWRSQTGLPGRRRF